MAEPDLGPHHSPRQLNQAEIYFSVLQRKALQPNNFADLDALEQHLLTFGRRYEQIATPFEWKFTRRDLERQMARLNDGAAGPVAVKARMTAANVKPHRTSKNFPASGAPLPESRPFRQGLANGTTKPQPSRPGALA